MPGAKVSVNRIDPRFIAVALALLAAAIGSVGAFATRPPIPPALTRPVARAIAPIIRVINPPLPPTEVRVWTPTTTAATTLRSAGQVSGATSIRTATSTRPGTKGSSRGSSARKVPTPTTTAGPAPTATLPTTTTSPPDSSLPAPLPTTSVDLTSSTLEQQVTSSTEVVP